MAYDVPKFLKRDGDSLLFNQDGQFVFYVPEIYFSRGDAQFKGEYVNLLGILDYTIIDDSGKNCGLKRFYFPTVFLCKPSRTEKVKNVHLKKVLQPKVLHNAAVWDDDPTTIANTNNEDYDNDSVHAQDYRLLIFEKGDAVVVSTKVPQNIANVEDFYRIFLTGKLPTTIPYDKLHEYFPESIRLNGASYGINMQMFGIVIGEMCRDPRDPAKAFRHTNFRDQRSYSAISIKNLPKYISPNSSISSENWDLGVIGAIMNPSDKSSPLEKLLMGN